MNRLISRMSNKIGVFYRRGRLRTVEGSIIRKLTIVLWLLACLTLIGCDFRGPTPAVTPTPVQSPTPSSVHWRLSVGPRFPAWVGPPLGP